MATKPKSNLSQTPKKPATKPGPQAQNGTKNKSLTKAGPTAPKRRVAKPSAPVEEAHRKSPQKETRLPPPHSQPLQTPSMIAPETLNRLEDVSLRMAKAAFEAQTQWAKGFMGNTEQQGASVSIDPFHVGPAMSAVATSIASHPEKILTAQAELFSGYLKLWSDMAHLGLETGASTPSPIRDKRFSDAKWAENPMYDMMRRSYLLSADWINNLVSNAEGVDPLEKRRAAFFTKLIVDAFAPSNFLMSNPAAMQTFIDSKGESLIKGMQQFADDLARGNGQLKISQSQYDQFALGQNMATTPGKVVFRNDYFELLQYTPTTDQVHDIPLLIFPPWINKFYILDLQEKNSLIRWLVAQGLSVFVVSWVNPDVPLAGATFSDYMQHGIYEAVTQTLKQTGAKSVNTVGYCIGGTLLGCALSHMAAKGDKRIGSATFFTAQHDFSEAGDLMLFTSEDWLAELEKKMDAAGGVLPGSAMADTFNALRANDLVWSFFVSNYLMGKDPPAFDLLCWNSDSTRMPKALHLFYLRKFYLENALAKGLLELDGVKIDLKTVKIPIYEQSGREDHIAPPGSVYKGSKLFGGPVTFMMAGSGHIAGVINPPEAQKYQYWTNDQHPDTLKAWQADAVEHPGSWWPHWASWLKPKSGKLVIARDPAKGPLKPLADAPGDYVRVKS